MGEEGKVRVSYSASFIYVVGEKQLHDETCGNQVLQAELCFPKFHMLQSSPHNVTFFRNGVVADVTGEDEVMLIGWAPNSK